MCGIAGDSGSGCPSGLFTKRPAPTPSQTSPLPYLNRIRHCEIAIAATAMPRTTRAAAKAETVHEDDTAATTEEATLNTSTRSQRNREPLRPLTPNSVDSVDAEKPTDQDMAGSKKVKKKAKGGKKNAKKKTTDGEKVNQLGMELEDDDDEANFGDSIASGYGPDNAKGMLHGVARFLDRGRSHMTRSRVLRLTHNSQESTSDVSPVECIPTKRPVSPSVKAGPGRRTRRQPAEVGPKARMPEELAIRAPKAGDAVKQARSRDRQTQNAKEPDWEPKESNGNDPTKQPMATKMDSIDASTQGAASEATTGQAEPSKEQSHLQNGVWSTSSPRRTGLQPPVDTTEAMNALEDELEEVVKNLPNLDAPDSPTKPMPPSVTAATKFMPAPEKAPTSKSSSSKTGPAATGKPTLGRAGSVRNGPANKLAKTTQSSALSSSSSIKSGSTGATNAKPSSGVSRSNSTKPRPSSVIAPPKDDTAAKETKTTDYLASRRRPISMHFPTPPPPPKSVKQPTKPTFTLPGDAITAKLKTAREDRLKREEEEAQKRREFKARPVPGSVRNKPVAAVKQTAASKARQSIMDGGNGASSRESKENTSAVVAGVKTTTTTPGVSLKRSSTVTGATTTSTKRTSSLANTTPAAPFMAPKPKPSTTEASASSFSRSSSLSRPNRQPPATARIPSNSSRTITATDVAQQRQKARAIFNRDREEKEARERERREKEEAAKRARAEAAERGRLASREWAERQRRRGEGPAVAVEVEGGE